MLLFILALCLWEITSSAISIHPMLLFILDEQISKIPACAFQYIPCYCLSNCRLNHLSALQDFNTSHVTVYPKRAKCPLYYIFDFNTSHVTVYQCDNSLALVLFDISIHPMLLFILMILTYQR